MPAISWDTSFVTSGSAASFGDDAIRSFLVNVATGLGASFYWPGSADSQGASTASSGELQLGTLRFARGGFLRGGFPNGFLSVNTKNVSIVHIGSTWTGTVGHSATLFVTPPSGFTFPQTFRWLVQEGQFNTAGSSAVTAVTTFPTPYLAAPVVFVGSVDPHDSLAGSGATCGFTLVGVSSVSTGGFTSALSDLAVGGGLSAVTSFVWRAEGVASL